MPQDYLPFKNPMDDKRRKLHPLQYPKVREYYKQVQSQRQTAKHFKISRRMVQWILNPEKLQAYQEQCKTDQHWKKYYNRKQLTECTRNLRKRKRKMGLTVKRINKKTTNI